MPGPQPASPGAASALNGLVTHTRLVAHASPEAQRWFDQGLDLVFGFNHDESLKAFARAAAASPG